MKFEMNIDIYGTVWQLKIINHLDCGLFKSDGGTLCGKCNFNSKEIIIADGNNHERLYEIITHEITHAVIMQMLLCKQDFTHEEVCEFMERYCEFICKLSQDVLERIEGYYEKR